MINRRNSVNLCTTTTKTSTLACSVMHFLFLTPLPPTLSLSVLPFLPAHSAWLLKCTVRRSRREWDRQPKRVKRTVQAFSNLFLEHYSNLYISKGLYEQQNWEHQEKLSQPSYASPLGKKSKVKGEVEGDALTEYTTSSNSTWDWRNILDRFLKLSSFWNYL